MAPIVPVAATWSTTSVTAAWDVRYWVAGVDEKTPGPRMAAANAPTPTTSSPPAASVPLFMRVTPIVPPGSIRGLGLDQNLARTCRLDYASDALASG